jgi:hypothetical protein
VKSQLKIFKTFLIRNQETTGNNWVNCETKKFKKDSVQEECLVRFVDTVHPCPTYYMIAQEHTYLVLIPQVGVIKNNIEYEDSRMAPYPH